MVIDTRWKQRFDNFARSLQNLEAGLALGEWNAFEKQGVIKAFELCFELAWKTLKDILEERELVEAATGPKAVLRASVEVGLLADPELWGRVHEGRNRAAHVYDAKKSETLFLDIQREFFSALAALWRTLENLE